MPRDHLLVLGSKLEMRPRSTKRFPPGVYKHRTIEDAKLQRDRWEEENFRALWKSRGIEPSELSEREGQA